MKPEKIIASAAIALAAVLGIAPPVAAQETTLRAVTFLRLDIDEARWFKEWVGVINKEGKGLVQIHVVGGPEVMNPFEMGNAVKNGVLDIAQMPPAYYQGLFPGAQAFVVANKSPVEQRKNGAFDYLNELYHERVNAHILTNWGYGVKFHLYLGKNAGLDKVRNADLSGLKLRVLPIYKPLFDALGGTSITMNQSEVYTALERGTVDGYGYIAQDLKGQGWQGVTKFRVDPGFYNVVNMTIMNWSKLQSLTPKQREFLLAKSAEVEAHWMKVVPGYVEQQYAAQKAQGIEVVTLNAAVTKKYLETARETGWADVKKKMPQQYEKLRKLLD
ncbi:MAG: ABC transporter substrate-binding protein [Betaproteobacteria bacterium]|nr:ABC transporter substrate-binding protein [Betaproteobacteria bacterium]